MKAGVVDDRKWVESITEERKAEDMMTWAWVMNRISNRADEIIDRDHLFITNTPIFFQSRFTPVPKKGQSFGVTTKRH